MPVTDPTFNFEVIKLMLQAAWADLRLEKEEAQLILSRARKLGLLPHQLATVEACLAGKERLPPPDLGLLRLHREEVLWTIRELFLVDTQFVDDEQDLFREIEQMLGS